MEKREMILEALKTADDSTIVDLWNEYCDDSNDPDNQIMTNDDDFFETYFDGRVTEAVRAAVAGDYNFSHDYVRFNGYANLESFDYMDDDNSPVDFDSLADWLIENKDEDEIAGLLGIDFEDEDEQE